MTVYTNRDNELCCPLCGDSNTHIDRVAMAARPDGEDGPIAEIAVTNTGDVSDQADGIPPSRYVGEGRRHRIALIGWCELCTGEFALLFTQHKGVTYTESVNLQRAVTDGWPA